MEGEVQLVRETLEGIVEPSVATSVLFDSLSLWGRGIPQGPSEVLELVRGPLRTMLHQRIGDEAGPALAVLEAHLVSISKVVVPRPPGLGPRAAKAERPRIPAETEAPEAPEEPGAGDEPELLFGGGPELQVSDEPELLFGGEPELQVSDEPELLFGGEPELQVSEEPELQVSEEPELQVSEEPELDIDFDIDIDEDIDEDDGDVTMTLQMKAMEQPVIVLVVAGYREFAQRLTAAIGFERVHTITVGDVTELRHSTFSTSPQIVVVDAAQPAAVVPGELARALKSLPDATISFVWGEETHYGKELRGCLDQLEAKTLFLAREEGIEPLLDLVLSRFKMATLPPPPRT